MKTQFKNQVLTNISSVYNALENNKMSSESFQQIDSELEYLSGELNLSKEEVFIFSMIFTLNLESSFVSYSSISKALKCNVIELMAFASFFQSLKSKTLIIEQREKGPFGRSSQKFVISEVVQEAVINNDLPLKPVVEEIKSPIELLEKIYELSAQHADEEITGCELFIRLDNLIQNNKDLSFIKNINQYKLNSLDRSLLFYLLWKTILGSETVYMSVALDGFIRNSAKRIRYCQKLISGENELIKNKLIELEKAAFFNDSDLKLSEKGRELLEKEGIKIGEIDAKDIVLCDSIRSKQLYYNKREKQNINILSKALKPDRFQEVQEILDSKDLPIGFNCIFYGPPGTGKTEGVLQLARKTGRDLMKVDISETKSKWFGDSEKLIKKIFTKYERIRISQELAPILLFNEADAILSKRAENSDSNADQTINTIQNILLEELENFKGIFIATTNLIDNLDKAFERRFLFKIQIDRPDIAARENIWKSKLDFLAPEQYLELARSFEFSGGEIENIIRKIITHEIINAEKIDFKAILGFCRQEKFEKNLNNNIEEKKTTILGFQNYKKEDPYLA